MYGLGGRRRRPVLALVPVLAVAATLGIASSASAATICVPSMVAGCDSSQATLGAALTAASGAAGDDAIELAAGTYTDGPWSYFGAVGNRVTISGAGIDQTILAWPATSTIGESYLTLGGEGNAVSDLTIDYPASDFNSDKALVLVQGADVSRVRIDGTGTSNIRAAVVSNAAVSELEIDAPTNAVPGTRAFESGGGNTIVDSEFAGGQAYNYSSPNTVDNASRLTLHPGSQGVVIDSGKIVLDDALIDLGTNNNAIGLDARNPNNGTADKEIDARHVTIVGGGTNSKGVRAAASASGAKQTSLLTLDDSVIVGPTNSIVRTADNDGSQGGPSQADVITDHSSYDAATVISTNGANGAGAVTETNLVPAVDLTAFASAVSGDYRPAADSPLIDAGNPAAAGPASDLDGADRVEDGDEDGAPVRDLGAYELQDLIAPNTSITTGPAAATNDPTPSFGFSSTPGGNTYVCAIDGGGFSPCSGPGASHTTAHLADGSHTFAVAAVDAAGNVDPSPATRAFKVDTTAPQTQITAGPSGPTADATPSFSFASSEAGSTFACKVDGGPAAACNSGQRTLAKLADGTHTFSVVATDGTGNADPTPASRAFKVDTTGPLATFTKTPKKKIRKGKAKFAFNANEKASFACALDGATAEACTSPLTLKHVKRGRHTFAVTGTDALGNSGATISYRFKRKR